MSDLLSQLPDSAFVRKDRSKFTAKLDHELRCAILAMHRAGVHKRVLAAAFGVDRRTIGHIVNPHSLKYKDVRDEEIKLGYKEFSAKYLTEHVVDMVKSALALEEAAKSNNTYKNTLNAQKSSNKHAGIHVVKPDQCQYSHRIEIRFFEEPGDDVVTVGWHYRDLDSKSNPDTWLHSGEESLRTSSDCYTMALLNLMDD